MISQWILLELQALVDNILTKLSLQLELHITTGIVVNNQNERSQIKNREAAMKMLKSKLYQLKLEEQEQEMAEIRGEQKDIGWEVRFVLTSFIHIQ